MSKINTDEVRHLAKLAQLTLNPQELMRYTQELDKVLGYISEIAEVKTGQHRDLGLTQNVSREDKTDLSQSLSQADALSGQDKVSNQLFVVPLVIDKDEK